jgi:CRISPR-associated endonuclease/helicase Cas3
LNIEEMPEYYRYWGKARDDGRYHLLPYHCLDVAAVGAAFLEGNPSVLARITVNLGLEPRVCRQYILLFLLLHDIGKFARQFQNLQPKLFWSLQGEKSETTYIRHDILGALCWSRVIRPYCAERRLLGLVPSRSRRVEETAPVDYWMRTAVGHHGRPVEAHKERDLLDVYFRQNDQKAVLAFFDDCYQLLFGDGSEELPGKTEIRRASWWLSGLTITCDWLGSNEDYFTPVSEFQSIETYWKNALKTAHQAIRENGLQQSCPSAPLGFHALFGERFRELTPLQRTCRGLSLNTDARLFLLEDVTGAGKTEAALMLAHRLISSNNARGLYFALPTMATANAMFTRMSATYRKLYADEAEPSLILAHGARKLHEGFRDIVVGSNSRVSEFYGDGTSTAQALCKHWFADHPKKALLADVGIGTVDQAVLGILPATHQGMRLLGLLGKVLIIDEVHAYDAYLFNLLKTLIGFHLFSGGSVILLSATLPLQQRQQLLDIYMESTGVSLDAPTRTGLMDYPLLTCAGANGLKEIVMKTRESVRRTVDLVRVDQPGEVEEIIDDAVRRGLCVCWIRNTVADARESYRALKLRHPEWSVKLFHARFSLKDRLEIEQDVLSCFGPESGANERKNRILIATPVVEQSLDLDFDLMISDLAPVDLIIQRAGRLCRHRRDVHGNPIEDKDQRGSPKLYLFAPEPVDQPNKSWFESFLPKAAAIYENHAQLWLGLRLLMEQGRFSMPDDARRLIEGVYGDVEIPEDLVERYDQSQGNRQGEAGLADYNALSLHSYYGDKGGDRWWDEARTPTRLGDSITLYLARWDGKTITPWRDDDDYPWQASTVSVLAQYLDDGVKPEGIPQELYDKTIESLPGKGRWGRLVVLCETDTPGKWASMGQKRDKQDIPIIYLTQEGFLVGNKECEEN